MSGAVSPAPQGAGSRRCWRWARSIRFFTNDGDHFEPPCGRSSWAATSRRVKSGFDEWIPATSGTPEPFRRHIDSALLQHPGNVVPGVIGAHAPYGWKPLIGSSLDSCAIGRLLGFGHLGQSLRSTSPDTRIARLSPLAARIPAFGHSEIIARLICATAPRTCSEKKTVVPSCRSDRGSTGNVRRGPLDPRSRARQAIEADDHQRIAGADLAQQSR